MTTTQGKYGGSCATCAISDLDSSETLDHVFLGLLGTWNNSRRGLLGLLEVPCVEQQLVEAFRDIGIECLVVWESEFKANPEATRQRVLSFLL
jgi:hypothetical protein